MKVGFKTKLNGIYYDVKSELKTRAFINGIEVWLDEEEAFIVNCEAVNLILDME